MPVITRIETGRPKPVKKKRVAAYARVSKGTDQTQHSLSAQVSYYSDLIQSVPDWEYAGVYADDGISGTDTKKREDFRRLLDDCEAGKVDIILAKSISRFARNTVDLLETVRHLKDIGVEVRFEKENISTMTGDGELMLTILASFAQTEVESMSQNIKWSIQKKFREGRLNGCVPFMGYRWDDDLKKLVVIPEEAETVRRIFYMYRDGYSLQNIVDALHSDGIKPLRGRAFEKTTIRVILTNITYTGNLLLQKTYSQDPITKKHVHNRGELPQYWSENTHEAIIDMETFEAVQNRLAHMRVVLNSEYYETRAFTRKIICGECGKHYSRARSARHGVSRDFINYYWVCSKKKSKGVAACPTKRIPEKKLKKICCDVLGWEEFDDDLFREVVDRIIVHGDILEFCLADGSRKEVRYA